MHRESGYTTIMALVLLFFIGALAASAYFLVATTNQRAATFIENTNAEIEHNTKVAEIIAYIQNREEDESDGIQLIQQIEENYGITITDISSKLNPNYERKFLFERSNLNSLFKDGKTAQDLQQYRADNGLSGSLDHYEDFFTEKALEEYLTVYSWCNINSTDEFVIEMIAEERSGDKSSAASLHQKVRDFLSEQKLFTQEEFEKLPIDADILRPAMDIHPQLNVNFVPEYILKQILAYPPYEIEKHASIAAEIIRLRETATINDDNLLSIVGLPKDHKVYTYLGTRTSFWNIDGVVWWVTKN